MKLTGLLILLASPAAAHHEAFILSAMPNIMVLLAALPVAGLAAWRRNRSKRKP